MLLVNAERPPDRIARLALAMQFTVAGAALVGLDGDIDLSGQPVGRGAEQQDVAIFIEHVETGERGDTPAQRERAVYAVNHCVGCFMHGVISGRCQQGWTEQAW
ncbi:hypothetical protein [Paraburkholderia sp. BL18I3N2]|uniref:hypothetical protein n=1 Tax=Paraburkholderia sp. BL18I3N2 TaxID=1938799 RepID=UPI000D08075A|nr:hypothetical protein [Paraburkholderia sp. BL18I3N2]